MSYKSINNLTPDHYLNEPNIHYITARVHNDADTSV